MYLQQLAFQAGDLPASLPILTVVEPVVAALLGVTLLHEQLQASGVRLSVLMLCVVAMAASTMALSRAQATRALAQA
jgi:threonine/homoserine efflux transporter RhtA